MVRDIYYSKYYGGEGWGGVVATGKKLKMKIHGEKRKGKRRIYHKNEVKPSILIFWRYKLYKSSPKPLQSGHKKM